MRLRYRALVVFFITASITFLLWPRSLDHFTYDVPCTNLPIGNCNYKEAGEVWRFGGGADAVCSLIFGAALNKNEGFTITHFEGCINRDNRFDTNSGHYYIDNSLNTLTMGLGSVAVGAGIAGGYLLVTKRRKS